MAIYHFNIGLKQLGKMNKRRAALLHKAVKKEWEKATNDCLNDLRARTHAAKKIDLGALLRGWATKKRHGGLEIEFINTAPHHFWVEFGRKPGKWPPISKIAAWCGRKLGDPTLGYVVSRKIATKGIAPTPLMSSLPFQRFAKKRFKSGLDKAKEDSTKEAIRMAKVG
jgi:hypothetical protein